MFFSDMIYVYLACIVIGLILSVLSLAFGMKSGLFYGNVSEIETDKEWQAYFGTAKDDKGIMLQPADFSVFVLGFGAAGYLIGLLYPDDRICLLMACLSGCAAATVCHLVMERSNKKVKSFQSENDTLKGIMAVVTENIPENEFGEVKYQIDGNTYNRQARSMKGNSIKNNTDVYIICIKDGVIYVDEKPDICQAGLSSDQNGVQER